MKDEEEKMSHPPLPTLEAIAAGDEAGSIAAHLAECEACEQHVAELRSDAAAFRANTDPVAFAEKIRVRARERGDLRRERRKPMVVWVLGPVLAAAAAAVLWLRLPAQAPQVEPVSSESAEHFKGGFSITVVRDRAGRQERLMGPFAVEPSDRIRLEIAVDREGPVTAGLLSEDGSWALLLAPASLAMGTHYSELAARFDDTPTDAVLLVGPPAAVDRARATRNFDGVIAWPVRSAPRK
jgi:hypothetical protein